MPLTTVDGQILHHLGLRIDKTHENSANIWQSGFCPQVLPRFTSNLEYRSQVEAAVAAALAEQTLVSHDGGVGGLVG